MERQTKQIILVRRDIKLPKGKMASQCCHASMACILDYYGLYFKQFDHEGENRFYHVQPAGEPVAKWLNGSFTKICLWVDSETQMFDLHHKALIELIPTSWIVDEGRTVYNEPTATCCAIGPWWSDELDKITGGLKLV